MEQIKNYYNDSQISDYLIIKQIEEHARKYDSATDKKEFLKNVSAYEQKVILLSSKRPYDVMKYIDEIDFQRSKIFFDSLTDEDIKKILVFFSSEDKESFYTNFSNLSLVNRFIIYDKNYYNYLDNLTFDRKIELLKSSNEKTIESASKIYENMTYSEKSKVSEIIENPVILPSMVGYTSSINSSYEKNIDHNENNFDEKLIEKTDLSKLKEESLQEENVEINVEINNIVDTKEEDNKQALEKKESLKNIKSFEESANQCENNDIEKITNKLSNIKQTEVTKTL